MDVETIRFRLREAWDVLRRVPAHGNPGFKSNWPEIVRDYFEAYGHTSVSVRLAPASPQAIDRMHEVFGWFAHLEGLPHLTRAVWLTCGAGMGPHKAGVVLGCHRNTARERRDEALHRIAEGLRKSTVARGRIVRQCAAIPT